MPHMDGFIFRGRKVTYTSLMMEMAIENNPAPGDTGWCQLLQEMAEESRSLEYTPTWVVTLVCFFIILISLAAECGLHHLGKFLKRKNQEALFAALQKLKEELMLLGFISLLLTAFQGLLSQICITNHLASYMLPCKMETSSGSGNNHEHYSHQTTKNGRRLLSENTGSEHCTHEGKVPFLSLEGLHQLHIFIFVLAVVHVIFCVTTMVLGGARIREWKYWEDSARTQGAPTAHSQHHHRFKAHHTTGHWRRTAVISWIIAFFKQFSGAVTKSDYVVLRSGFIQKHCPSHPKFDFHKYILRTLEHDFKRIVGISWYLWLFVVIFLLLNIEGWHTYFWLSFLPIVLLLLVGAKLEHVITRLAEDVAQKKHGDHEAQPVKAEAVKPSDEHFWFGRPRIVLYLIHFILFQNAFEIAFFFWIWTTYGFRSCIMDKLGYIIPRLLIGVIVQVLCSYSTLPLYALVTQMGSMFKPGMFEDHIQNAITGWAEGLQTRSQMSRMTKESFENVHSTEESTAVDEGITSIIELSCPNRTQMSSP
uniref:MLO-like protein n=1 Tax=Davidia involucrata TaxID=16924 RepID=A0A5B7AIJ7_DAVIN